MARLNGRPIWRGTADRFTLRVSAGGLRAGLNSLSVTAIDATGRTATATARFENRAQRAHALH